MNPFFIVLVILGAFIAWLFFSAAFSIIANKILKLINFIKNLDEGE